MDAQLFRNTPKQYRPAPFWSWNDDLQPDELRRQVRDMQEKGYGGYFMHARAGLDTEYLSEAWMRCVAACLDEGQKVGMESWLYDEDRWPSGFAGGLVPAQNEEFRARNLQCVVLEKDILPEGSKPVALFSCALTTAMALARSLKEAVGLRPSSLTHRCLRPSSAASRSAR